MLFRIIDLAITSILSILFGLLWLNKRRIPKLVQKIPYFEELLGFTFWLFTFRVLVLFLDIVAGRSLDVNHSWPAYIQNIEFNLNNFTGFLLLILAVLGFFIVTLRFKKILDTRLTVFFTIAIFAMLWNIVTLNGLQGGIINGLSNPDGAGKIYFNVAVKFNSAWDIVNTYNQIQATLNAHSITHPFGPVILFFFLNNLFNGNLFFMSLFIAIISCSIVFPSYLLFKQLQLPEKTCRVLVVIFAFIPSVVIYFGTSIDAIVALLLTTAIATFIYALNHNNCVSAIISGVAIYLGMLMTFIGLFVMAVVVLWSLVYNIVFAKKHPLPSIKIPIIALLIPVLFLLVTNYVWGFNYLQSFITASRYVNPTGFRLFAEPLNYLVTRLEDIWDILLFFGPVCSVLAYQTIKRKTLSSEYNFFALIGIFVLFVLFLMGTSETGETARVSLLILPFLLILLPDQLKDIEKDSLAIMSWLFVQTVLFQIFFSFYW